MDLKDIRVGERYIIRIGNTCWVGKVTSIGRYSNSVNLQFPNETCQEFGADYLEPYFEVGDICRLTLQGRDFSDCKILEVLDDFKLMVEYKGNSEYVALGLIEDVYFTSRAQKEDPNICICDRHVVFNSGCKCGAFKREQERKARNV